MMEKHCWFRDWFNSPYYHLLYNKRDENEADFFISNLCDELQLPSGSRIWDVACGKGRHTLALHKKGYEAVGTDLSEKSIREALTQKAEGVDFFIHDMREPFRVNYFDAAVNLFTSLGYFENQNDNLKVFKNVCKALKPGGKFVVDFFNAEKVKRSLKAEQVETRGDIAFHIKKEIINNVIHKKINFEHQHQAHTFEETVSLLKKEDFEKFAAESGLTLQHVFGDYSLQPFDENRSERLILIFKK
jgi:SAM-dependent methyltransferase